MSGFVLSISHIFPPYLNLTTVLYGRYYDYSQLHRRLVISEPFGQAFGWSRPALSVGLPLFTLKERKANPEPRTPWQRPDFTHIFPRFLLAWLETTY